MKNSESYGDSVQLEKSNKKRKLPSYCCPICWKFFYTDEDYEKHMEKNEVCANG